MKSVVGAIEKGRGVLAVGGAVLRDPDVMLAITERPALPSIALSGPATAPALPMTAESLARATGQAGGAVYLVDPQNEDMPAVKRLGELLRQGQHKPVVIVVAQQFNAFAFMGLLSGLKLEHHKARAQAFFKELPHPPPEEEAPAPEVAAAAKGGKGGESARFVFVGRDEETAALAALLGSGGPVVVSGPKGVGRTQLLEHAIEAAGLKRLPDYALARGSGFDGLINLLATAAAGVGVTTLLDAVKAHMAPPALVAVAVEALQQATGLDGHVLVVHELQVATGREGDFFRKSRLELLIRALIGATYPLRLAFVSTHQPVIHREADDRNLRRFEVGGIKGRFLHDIFEGLGAPEFPRERFGPISERIHGHPAAARAFAVAVRDRTDGLALTEDEKFLKADSLEDTDRLVKNIAKRLERLDSAQKDALAILAHLRAPVDGQILSDLGVSRKTRSSLLHLGLLDMVGTLERKGYRVHALVRAAIPRRALDDYDVYCQLAAVFAERAKQAEGIEQVALAHWSRWAAEMGRDGRVAFRHELVDDDAFVDTLVGMIRRKDGRPDLAEKLVRQAIDRNPANSDAHLVLLEALDRRGASEDEIVAAAEAAVAQAPVPEVFHQIVTFWMRRKARTKAVQVLEHAVSLLPDESRLKARLASLLLRQGRRPEAIELLRQAMDLDPMLPDAYGLLGMARLDEGLDALDEAEQLIREGVRLAPNDEVQVSRLVSLLMDRARIADTTERRDALFTEAKALLDERLTSEDKSPHVLLLLASLVRQRGGDLEQAKWLVKEARKKTERRSERRHRIKLEQALIDFAEGKLDPAEAALRELADQDPTNPQVFMGLAQVLVARDLLVPAHAEYLRARDRAAAHSIDRFECETELTRLQALIEHQAHQLASGLTSGHGHGLGSSSAPSHADVAAMAEQPMIGAGAKVIRRRGHHEDEAQDEAPVAEEEAVEAVAPAEPVEAVEAVEPTAEA